MDNPVWDRLLSQEHIEARHHRLRGKRHVQAFMIKNDSDSPICRCGDLFAVCLHRIRKGGECPVRLIITDECSW